MAAHDHTTPRRFAAVALAPRYRISDDGVVEYPKSGGWSPLRLKPDDKGYLYAALHLGSGQYKRRQVGQLVLTAFVGPCPDGQECRHLNGNPGDNRLNNLAWGTRRENAQDRIRHGTQARGSASVLSLLDESKVEEARRLYSEGHSQSSIARKFGVSRATVGNAVVGKTWRHVPGAIADQVGKGRPCGMAHRRAKLTDDEIEDIRRQAGQGISQRRIARLYGVGQPHVSQIVNGLRRSNAGR
jgi:predicted transcriptional regulator